MVAVTDHLAEAGVETPILQEVADLELLQTVDEMEVVRRARHAAILLVYHDIKLTSKSLGELPNLRAVIRCGVGFDNVDLQAAGQRGIVVCNVPDYGTEEVADHAVMLLLACARRLIPCHDAIRQDRWDLTAAFGTPRLRGRTLGLIGCGRIGTA
ncbi:MAG: NAD(P)-dependent oxidoreductase, partial [Gemmataceae bacterium]